MSLWLAGLELPYLAIFRQFICMQIFRSRLQGQSNVMESDSSNYIY